MKEVCYLGAITWIPEITEHCDDIVLKVALKNYSLNTLIEENIWNSKDWAQGNQRLNPGTILFPGHLDIEYMESMKDIWNYNKHTYM